MTAIKTAHKRPQHVANAYTLASTKQPRRGPAMPRVKQEKVQVIIRGWWIPVALYETLPGQFVRFAEWGPVFIVEEPGCTAIRPLKAEDFDEWNHKDRTPQ